MNPNSCRFLGQKWIFIVFAMMAFLLAPCEPWVLAEEQSDDQNDWEFQVAPYMWFISADGDLTVKGNKKDISLDFSDIWEEFNIGAMVEFEGRKNKFGFYGNVIYGNLGKDASAGDVLIDPDINILWTSLGGTYRVGTWNLSEQGGKETPTVTLDTYLAIRYTYLDIELGFEGIPIPKKEGDQEWLEPLLGVRTIWSLSERWKLSVAGGIGGVAFGSDFAWDAFGLLGYQFSLFGNDNATVFGGYKAMYQDYDDGDGADKFEWDITLHGPIAGLKIAF
jgi:hypothetical protein